MMKNRASFFTLLLAFACLAALCLPAQRAAAQEQDASASNKPTLIMGDAYGKYEKKAVIAEVLTPNDLTFDDGGEYTSAENWHHYSQVIVCDAAKLLSEQRELDWARDYVQDGGRLVLLGSAMLSFRGVAKEELAWLGASGYSASAKGDAAAPTPEHWASPQGELTALSTAMQSSFWVTKIDQAKPLLTIDSKAVAFAHSFGQGEIVFLGKELFRLRAAQRASKDTAPGDAYRDWLQRVILHGQPLRKAELIQSMIDKLNVTGPTAWYRDPGFTARGGAFLRYPAPREQDLLESITLDMGVGEYESVPVYVTTPVAVADFPVRLSKLSGDAGTLDPAGYRMRMQGLAKPDLTVGPYWLIDADNPSAPTFSLGANSTNTFWLTLHTRNAKPGTYRGQITLGDQHIPITINVWNVNLPGPEYFDVLATYMWNSLGADPRKAKLGQPLDYTRFDRHIDNLASHHVSYNMDAYWPTFLMNNAVLKEDGTPLLDAIKTGRVTLNNLPALDLSMYNHFVDAPIKRGMPYYHYLFKNRSNDWLRLARTITGNDELEPDSREHQQIKAWLLHESLSYLRDRGLRRIITAIADEIPPEEVAEVVERSHLMKSLGMRPMLTVTGQVGRELKHLTALAAVCDIWTWNMTIMSYAQKLVRDNPSILEPTDLQYTYTADWHRAAYVRNRSFGAFCAWHQLDGWFIHGYLRWYPNGGGVFAGEDGPIDTEGWEGARDGIEDARYLARLEHLCEQLARDERAASRVRQIRAELAKLLGPQPDALMQVKPVHRNILHTRYDYHTPSTNMAGLRELKKQVLTWLAELEPMHRDAGNLHYDGQMLVEQGTLAVAIAGPEDMNAALTEGLAKRVGSELAPLRTRQAVSRILLGDETNNTHIAALGSDNLGVNDRYPAAGEFAIITVDARSQRVLDHRAVPLTELTTVIYGRDAHAVEKGIAQFINLTERTR